MNIILEKLIAAQPGKYVLNTFDSPEDICAAYREKTGEELDVLKLDGDSVRLSTQDGKYLYFGNIARHPSMRDAIILG